MSVRRDIVLSPDRQNLKVATRDLVREYGGTDAAGELLGRRQQAISDLCLAHTDRFISIDDVAKLEDRTVGRAGHPIVTRALAKRQGYLLVPLPSAPDDPANFSASVMRMAEELGDVSREITAAYADDGKVDETEAARILAEVRHLETETARLRLALERIEKGAKA